MSCACIDIEMGSYDNQVELEVPAMVALRLNTPGQERVDTVCVDQCLEREVGRLWSLGIATTGCCCGHNKVEGYIGVLDMHIPRMKAMGYLVAPNRARPGTEDSFYPKSLTYEGYGP